jgi:hypothetical protein
MKSLLALSLLALTLVALPLAGCNDEGGGDNRREPRTILIPSEMTLAEAGEQAVAGDTLLIADLFITLDATVEFREAQTPLLIRGTKNYPLITILTGDPPLRFVNPRAGTKVSALLLSAPAIGIEAVGPGDLAVENCRFTSGDIQVRGRNSGLVLVVADCLMRDAGLFSIDVEGGSTLIARGNTVDAAGDCSIRLQSGATGTVRNNILHRSTNYGVACLGNAALTDSSGCNDVHLSGNAPYLGCEAPESDFDLDPLFCDLVHGVFTLVSISPCTAANSGGCGRIGAFPAACEPE